MKGTSDKTDHDLIQKILHTLSHYELQCDTLQMQVDALKNVINHLMLLPKDGLQTEAKSLAEVPWLEEKLDPIILQVAALQRQLIQSGESTEAIKGLLAVQKSSYNQDSLTQLANRGTYDRHLLELFQQWQNTQEPFILVLADIDHFKQINDNFGHLVGDKVLKEVAFLLKSSVKAEDFVARIGGEEFALLLENTSPQRALNLVEKICKKITKYQFHYKEASVFTSLSFGLTSIKQDDSLESLFIRADQALYQAKGAGRDQARMM